MTLSAIALGYILSKSDKTFALVGTTNVSHFIESARAGGENSVVAAMSPQEIRFLEDGTISESLRHVFYQIQQEKRMRIIRALRLKGRTIPLIPTLVYSVMEAMNEIFVRVFALFSLKSVQQ